MRSVLGGAAFITSDVDMFNKLRKAAADLGADAVIVMREGSSRAAWASGSGSWNPMEDSSSPAVGHQITQGTSESPSNG